MSEQTWLWIGCIGMIIGAAVIFISGGRRTPREELATIFHGTVPVIAACSYFAMAVGQGSILRHSTVGAGVDYQFYFARYVDWLFTTPLLLAGLTMTAQHASLRRPGLLVGVLGADIIMIVTALFFGLSEVAWIKWTWFLISCVAFLAVYYVIWVGLREEAATQREDVRSAYTTHAAILSVLWLIYPLVLAAAPDGLNMISSTLAVACITILDLVSKVAYGLLTASSHAQFAERDLKIGEAAMTMTRRAA